MFLCIKNGFHQSFITRGISYLPCTRLQDKVAIVTASTAGIGLAVATRLGLEGAKVAISSRDQNNVDRALNELKKKGITAIGTVCDINNADHRKKLLEMVTKELGEVDILIPHISKSLPCKILECAEKDWNEIIDTNLKAAYFLAQETVPIMLKKKSGKIVFISSVASYNYLDQVYRKDIHCANKIRVKQFAGTYSIAKTGIIGLIKTLAWHLALKGVIVNGIAPGLINTKSISESDPNKIYAEQIPMKRYGTVDDIAAGVAFLASDDASYITGEIIVIGGGLTGRL